jgi:hypothetical protein
MATFYYLCVELTASNWHNGLPPAMVAGIPSLVGLVYDAGHHAASQATNLTISRLNLALRLARPPKA